jgi:16S rRNA processing protein RimM
MRGLELLLPRAAAPALGPDEWWAADLEGCTVTDGSVAVGVVRRMLALPSCEVLEVSRAAGGPDLLVPLVRDAVRSVDVAARRIDVDLVFLGEG